MFFAIILERHTEKYLHADKLADRADNVQSRTYPRRAELDVGWRNYYCHRLQVHLAQGPL